MNSQTDDSVEDGLAEGADSGENVAHEVKFTELLQRSAPNHVCRKSWGQGHGRLLTFVACGENRRKAAAMACGMMYSQSRMP